ncbi:MAG: flagellar filament capping protein FliD [Acidobacteriaceae bacterium]
MAVSGININSGLGTGLDIGATVDALIQAQSGPLTQLQNEQQNLQIERTTVSSFASLLSNLKTAVDNLRDAGGAFDGVAATSSNSGVATVSADATAQPGKHTLLVNNLASGSAYYTAEQTSPTAALAQGSFQLQIGAVPAQTITVDSSNNTLAGIATTINGLGLGVQASVLQDANGARLSISSTGTGAGSNINISADSVGLGFTKSSTGADASYSVDGVPLASASNTVTGVLQGLTFNLASLGSAAIAVSPDTAGAQNALGNFVSAYNSLTQSINSQFAVNPATGQAGVLSGDVNVRQLQQEMLSDASINGAGSSFNTLRSIGVEMQNDGTLQINQPVLTSALNGNFGALKTMFQSTGGYGQQLGSDLVQATDPTVGLLGSDGSGLDNQITSIAAQIKTFNDYLNSQRTALTQTYTNISVMLQQEPAQLAQIQSLLGSNTTTTTK